MSGASGTIGSAGDVSDDVREGFDHDIVVGGIVASYAQNLGKLVLYCSKI